MTDWRSLYKATDVISAIFFTNYYYKIHNCLLRNLWFREFPEVYRIHIGLLPGPILTFNTPSIGDLHQNDQSDRFLHGRTLVLEDINL